MSHPTHDSLVKDMLGSVGTADEQVAPSAGEVHEQRESPANAQASSGNNNEEEEEEEIETNERGSGKSLKPFSIEDESFDVMISYRVSGPSPLAQSKLASKTTTPLLPISA
eukprot:1689099-Rhodomonas_salina.1